ncbi:hypothetical protein [Enterococcus hirae]
MTRENFIKDILISCVTCLCFFYFRNHSINCSFFCI